MNKKTSRSPRRSVITGTLLARFKKWKRNLSLSLSLIMIQSLYSYFSFHVVSNNAFHGSFSLFKECPHPDEKQRMKLSQDLGLKPRQVKFWFQNRRTQMKVRNLASLTSSFLKISTVFGLVCAMKRIPCSSNFYFHGNRNPVIHSYHSHKKLKSHLSRVIISLFLSISTRKMCGIKQQQKKDGKS